MLEGEDEICSTSSKPMPRFVLRPEREYSQFFVRALDVPSNKPYVLLGHCFSYFVELRVAELRYDVLTSREQHLHI